MKKHTKLDVIYTGGIHGTRTVTIDVQGNPGELSEVSRHDLLKLMDGACGVKKCWCGASMMSVLEPDWLDEAKIRIPAEGNTILVNPTVPLA